MSRGGVGGFSRRKKRIVRFLEGFQERFSPENDAGLMRFQEN